MLSVILCTYNPRSDLLSWTLSSLANQTLPHADWELIIVDNRSTPPLQLASFLPSTLAGITRLIREEEPGLSAARCAGIKASRSELLVFVDDDNYLRQDYLAQAMEIARFHPELGCFGGVAEAKYECPPAEWTKSLLGNLGIRDFGPEPITSRNPNWGPWEPIGAGMVVQRVVAESFCDFFRKHSHVTHLGRKENSLASSEDSLIAHLSLREGLANSYQPSLHLTHFIKDRRVAVSYLARLLLAMGESYGRLQEIKGRPFRKVPLLESARNLAGLFGFRLQHLGDSGFLQWFWDIGNAKLGCTIDWPRISVVIPTFNSGATLHRTLESLRAQAYPNLEIIVQDGASTDDTLAILKGYPDLPINFVSAPDRGQADAINRGFQRCTGEIRAWLCSDDEYRPGALYYAALQFILHPEHDFLIGGCLRIFPDGSSAVVRPEGGMLPELGYRNFIDQPATFWRQSLQEKAGPVDESLTFAFDWEYWNRFIKMGARPMVFPEQLAVYYFSDQNKTSTAGSKHVPELTRIVSLYGPLNGRLAKIYNFLYENFDLAGCYDSPPSAPPPVMRRFHIALKRLAECYGENLIYAYNWTYASKQARKLVWYR